MYVSEIKANLEKLFNSKYDKADLVNNPALEEIKSEVTFEEVKNRGMELGSLLVENGFITREPVDYDARLKKLVLTEKATEVFKIMRNDRAALEDQMLKGFSDEEKKQLLGMDMLLFQEFYRLFR